MFLQICLLHMHSFYDVMAAYICWLKGNNEACGVVEYAMVRPTSLWGTVGGKLDDSARWVYYMGVYLWVLLVDE